MLQRFVWMKPSHTRRIASAALLLLCVLASPTGCGRGIDSPQRLALTTFTNDTGSVLTLRSEPRTYPVIEMPIPVNESVTIESLYVRNRHPQYQVQGKVGPSPQAVRVRRVQSEMITSGQDAALEAERVTVRLVDDNGRLRARADRGIKVYSDPLP